RLENDRYVTLLHCKLEALYPIPRLRAEAYSPTVEEIELCPLGAAVYVSGPTGKDEGRVFTTLQNATGNLKLKVITRESSKLHINFSVQ
ncbi:MAG TPA: hypothetical protein VJJ98_09290, partial [Sedimentisphaerales bacterium]|nr:hypothetical protein [Sedimentisphaerales bacterium]